jgi:hypothetical protein
VDPPTPIRVGGRAAMQRRWALGGDDHAHPERSSNVSFIAVSHERGRDGMDRETFSLLSDKLASVHCSLFLVRCSLTRTTSFLEQILSVVTLTRYLVRAALTT